MIVFGVMIYYRMKGKSRGIKSLKLLKDETLFIEDITASDTYFAVTIRSPVAKGRLQSIDTPPLPQYYTLLTAKDIPGINQLYDFPVPVLAWDELSYIGEPVALLLGPDESILRKLAEYCRVIAKEENPLLLNNILSPETVLKERKIELSPGSGIINTETTENDSHSDEDEAKQSATVKGSYKTGIQEHWYTDTHGAVAMFSEERLNVFTASQWIFHVKRSVTQMLNIDSEKVVVEPSCIGIHLEGKLWYPSLVACHAALGAFVLNKAVKLILTREEDFRFSPKRNASKIEMQSVLDSNGEITETEIKVLVDLGSQEIFADEILDKTLLGCLGAYHLGHIRIEGNAVRTSIPPQGPLGGFGLSQGFFALERHVSKVADSLRQDPAEWRKDHAFQKNEKLGIGVILEKPPLKKLIDTVSKTSGYHRKWAAYELMRQHRRSTNWKTKDNPLRGIGIAVAYQGSGFLYSDGGMKDCAVEVSLKENGVVEIRSSIITPSNTAYSKIWKRMAEAILDLKEDKVHILFGNTDTALDCGPGSNSRNISVVSDLVEQALWDIATEMSEKTAPFTVRKTYQPILKSPWAGHSLSAPEEPERKIDEQALSKLAWGAAVVEVEIDEVEFNPNIRGIWLIADGGKLLSEKRARTVLMQSSIHALGWATWEDIYYNNEKITDSFIYDYRLPAPGEIPPISIDFIRKNDSFPKGIGELPFSTIPASFIQAISQAVDYHFERIPLSAQDLWESLNLKYKEVKEHKGEKA